MILVGGDHLAATPAISPGVERSAGDVMDTFFSALGYLSPGEWTLAAAIVLAVVALGLMVRRTGPREELTQRWRREAREHRRSDAGFITFTLAGAVLAGCGLCIVLTAEDSAVRAVAVVMAVLGGAFAVFDLIRSLRR